MSPDAKRLAGLERAHAKRSQISVIRQALRRGEITLEDVLLDPPEVLASVPLLDVLQMDRDRDTRSTTMWKLNGAAVQEGVNLMLPVGRASEQTRRFAIALGTKYRGRRRLGVAA